MRGYLNHCASHKNGTLKPANIYIYVCVCVCICVCVCMHAHAYMFMNSCFPAIKVNSPQKSKSAYFSHTVHTYSTSTISSEWVFLVDIIICLPPKLLTFLCMCENDNILCKICFTNRCNCSYVCSMLVHTQEDILMFDNFRPK